MFEFLSSSLFIFIGNIAGMIAPVLFIAALLMCNKRNKELQK